MPPVAVFNPDQVFFCELRVKIAIKMFLSFLFFQIDFTNQKLGVAAIEGHEVWCGLHVKNGEIRLGIFTNSGFLSYPVMRLYSNTQYSEAQDILFSLHSSITYTKLLHLQAYKICILKN